MLLIKEGVASFTKDLVKNQDGSVNIYFGPKATTGKEIWLAKRGHSMGLSFMSRIPIRVSVPVLIAAPVLIIAVVLSWLATGQHQMAAQDLTRQNLLQTHKQIQAHLDQLLDAPGRINRVNAELLAQGMLPTDDLPRWRDTLITELRAYSMLSSIVWGSADGQATWICRYIGDDDHIYYALKGAAAGENITEYRIDASGKVESKPSGTFKFDPRIRPWYIAPIRANGPAWCEPFLWVGGGDAKEVTLGISYGQPVRDSAGAILGVIDADLSLNDISHYLEKLQVGKTGGAYLVDRKGYLIGSSMGASLADAEGKRLLASDSGKPRIAASARHIEESIGPFAGFTEIHQDTITSGGQKLFLLASPYRHSTGLRWRIVTLIPEDDFLADVRAGFRRSLLWSVLAAVGALVFGLIVSLFMVKPILTLTSHVRRIGQGELDEELHLRQSPEMIRLSEEINTMSAGLRDRLRMRQALALAMDVQQNLLPAETPQIEGLDIAGHSTYCDETGGDYYDFLDVSGLSESTVAVALGDVVGHGIAAAMMMAGARGVLRSRCGQAGSLADLLQHMNSHLCEDAGIGSGRFMTMFLMTLDAIEKKMRWASAGHDMPFIYEPGFGFHEIEGGGIPLAVLPGEEYREYSFDGIRPGQVILAGTDGVWETFSEAGEEYGKQRVCDLIERHASRPAEEISQALQTELATYRGDSSQLDDVTLIVIRVL
jgi:sigma-B regulation protein RsbU (phosphoserine phosphatase)